MALQGMVKWRKSLKSLHWLYREINRILRNGEMEECHEQRLHKWVDIINEKCIFLN